MKHFWSRARKDDGAVAVELAMSAIIFLTVLIGSFEAFMAVYAYHYASYAAREGARYAIVRGSDCSSDSGSMPGCGADQSAIQLYIYDLNFPGVNVNNVAVNVAWLSATTSNGTTTWTACATGTPGTCNVPGNQVQVKVTYNNPMNIPFIPASLMPLYFSSTSTMVISQ
jgi:Flp pilus assembly protein TadG